MTDVADNAVAAHHGSEDAPSYLKRFWRSDARRRYWRNKLGVISLYWIVLVAVVAVFGPYFAQDPNLATPASRLLPPSGDHLFGTDHLGRDVFARVLIGGRISLWVALTATAASVGLGLVVGTIAGYVGGVVDDIVSRVLDVLIALPALLFGIIVVVALGGSMSTVIVAVSIGTMPRFARLFRAGVISVKPREYVQSAISLGLSPWRIGAKHVVPNIVIPVLVIATGNMGRLALAEASLSYLGAGIQPPTASWGNIISDGQAYLQYAPWIPVIPGTVLTMVSLAFSFVGDALRDAFDIHESVGAGSDATT